jgi:hypothetical protein
MLQIMDLLTNKPGWEEKVKSRLALTVLNQLTIYL